MLRKIPVYSRDGIFEFRKGVKILISIRQLQLKISLFATLYVKFIVEN